MRFVKGIRAGCLVGVLLLAACGSAPVRSFPRTDRSMVWVAPLEAMTSRARPWEGLPGG